MGHPGPTRTTRLDDEETSLGLPGNVLEIWIKATELAAIFMISPEFPHRFWPLGEKKRWETPADMLLLLLLLLLLLFAEHLRGPLRTWFSTRSLMVGGVEPSCHCLTM